FLQSGVPALVGRDVQRAVVTPERGSYTLWGMEPRTPTESDPHHCHTPRFDSGNPLAENNIRRALWLTAVMMVIEIVGGWWFNSMAVLADGWHMSSHALALGLSVFAYAFARRHAGSRRYAFGTWKVEVLGSYTSAILLLGIAALM